MPEQFWRLTVREFNLKWDAFSRHDDRQRALMLEHASLVGNYDDRQRAKMTRLVNQLRRYPIKRWLAPELPT